MSDASHSNVSFCHFALPQSGEKAKVLIRQGTWGNLVWEQRSIVGSRIRKKYWKTTKNTGKVREICQSEKVGTM